ncbi:AAA-like domain-containing protein [Blautia schinkii]|nr:AAA-like domain-containing protein [Blautia schinkii]
MKKRFNVTGLCIPEKHYMVDISGKIKTIIENYIEPGYYFAINRARQFGKTTTLYQLENMLKEKYYVISISFEGADDLFISRDAFVKGFLHMVAKELKLTGIEARIIKDWNSYEERDVSFQLLDDKISTLCRDADRGIVLQIDEVDKSSDNQIFLSFLGILRDKYLDREKGKDDTFHNVILSGVYDVKNLKLKIRSDMEHKYNSPWNIAESFDMDMSFSASEIESMLEEYENDNHFKINVKNMSEAIYSYTSGYPYLVSQVCKLMDEAIWQDSRFKDKTAVWCEEGIRSAVKLMLMNRSPLFDDINKNIELYPDLNQMVQNILLRGKSYPYTLADNTVQMGVMLGYFMEKDYKVAVTNRIFETYLYDLFYMKETKNSEMADAGTIEKSQFIIDGDLDMNRVLERFKAHYDSFYGEKEWKFVEEEGRLLFLTFLKPIINGVGFYYIEAHTRDQKRTDIIVD